MKCHDWWGRLKSNEMLLDKWMECAQFMKRVLAQQRRTLFPLLSLRRANSIFPSASIALTASIYASLPQAAILGGGGEVDENR